MVSFVPLTPRFDCASGLSVIQTPEVLTLTEPRLPRAAVPTQLLPTPTTSPSPLPRPLRRLCLAREVRRSRPVPGTASDIMVCVFGTVSVWVAGGYPVTF